MRKPALNRVARSGWVSAMSSWEGVDGDAEDAPDGCGYQGQHDPLTLVRAYLTNQAASQSIRATMTTTLR